MIEKTRVNSKKTQKEVADATGFNIETVRRYEKGSRTIPLSFLKKFCLFMEVPSDFILDIPRDIGLDDLQSKLLALNNGFDQIYEIIHGLKTDEVLPVFQRSEK